MANLKEIRTRITSVNSTRQITQAMKMVSAAKLKRAQDAILRMRPYANKLSEILANVSASVDGSEGVYTAQREVKNVLVISITSNRGLCGAFNANVIKQVNRLIREDFTGKNVTVLSIGKKSNDFFKRTEHNIKGSLLPRNASDIFDKLTYEGASLIAHKVMGAYANKQFDKVVLVYNAFKNAAVQELTVEQFLPVIAPVSDNSNQNDYIFEPSKIEIVADLMPRALKTQLYKALLDSVASEHGARMTAMHKATDNASDLLKELKLKYNKERQAAITTEILEIVAGAEALNG